MTTPTRCPCGERASPDIRCTRCGLPLPEDAETHDALLERAERLTADLAGTREALQAVIDENNGIRHERDCLAARVQELERLRAKEVEDYAAASAHLKAERDEARALVARAVDLMMHDPTCVAWTDGDEHCGCGVTELFRDVARAALQPASTSTAGLPDSQVPGCNAAARGQPRSSVTAGGETRNDSAAPAQAEAPKRGDIVDVRWEGDWVADCLVIEVTTSWFRAQDAAGTTYGRYFTALAADGKPRWRPAGSPKAGGGER